MDDDTAGAGLAGLAHSESRADVVARYDEWATRYDTDLADWGYSVPEVIAHELFKRVAPDAGGSTALAILDAGCGTGLIGRAVHDLGFEPIDGIDASAESLAVAGRTNVYRDLTVADLSRPLSVADAGYGAVVCGGVLTYLADTEAVLRELLRVTRPGGWVIASQRTDLWAERGCDGVIEQLVADGLCAAEVSVPQPYLPGHDEYAAQILVKFIHLHRS